jgi:hypothetical protein
VIAHGELRDPVQPARQVAAVERSSLRLHDQEDLLREILGVRARHAQRVEPFDDVVEPALIDVAEPLFRVVGPRAPRRGP